MKEVDEVTPESLLGAPQAPELIPLGDVLEAGRDLRVVALECAAHLWAGDDADDHTAVLAVADAFMEWLEGPLVEAVIEDAPQLDPARQRAYWLIDAERDRQEAKFPGQSCAGGLLSDTRKFLVLAEEVGEVAKALLGGDHRDVRDELVQVAAVAVAWLEHLTDSDGALSGPLPGESVDEYGVSADATVRAAEHRAFMAGRAARSGDQSGVLR